MASALDRLWGEHGQELLERGHVALLNATATGTETLKNLVLPGTRKPPHAGHCPPAARADAHVPRPLSYEGVGTFTIIDGQRVSGADAGVNFFLTVAQIGTSRARAACELLQELNQDEVVGHYIEQVGGVYQPYIGACSPGWLLTRSSRWGPFNGFVRPS